MTITFGWAWWVYVLIILAAAYLVGFAIFWRLAGFKFALLWPLFYLCGGINVQ